MGELTLDVSRGEHRWLEALGDIMGRNAPGLMRVPLQLAAPVGNLRQQLICARALIVTPCPSIAVFVSPTTDTQSQ